MFQWEFLGDWREPQHPSFTPVALDGELLRVSHSAMGLHGLIGELVRDLCGQILQHCRFNTAVLALLIHRCCLVEQQGNGRILGKPFRKREGDALVSADWPFKYDALLGVLYSALEGSARKSDCRRRNQNSLCVEACQQMIEALPHGADYVALVHEQAVIGNLIRGNRIPTHFGDWPDIDLRLFEISKKQGH